MADSAAEQAARSSHATQFKALKRPSFVWWKHNINISLSVIKV
jgi:hypothetical protein